MMLVMTDVFPQPNGRFRWVQAIDGRALPGPALVCEPLLEVSRHFFTTRDWSLGSRQSPQDDGWGEIAGGIGVAADRLCRVNQVHGADVALARGGYSTLQDADILWSRDAELAVAIQTADCVPVLLSDPRSGTVAAAHAGWRGLAAQVPIEAVGAVVRASGSDPAELVVAIGPAIGPCCYEVGADVRERFARGFPGADAWFAPAPSPGKYFLDTWASARAQLERAGVDASRIFVAALCTACHPQTFNSYRRDGPPAGRMAAVITSRRV
jgi:YfiH family protein